MKKHTFLQFIIFMVALSNTDAQTFDVGNSWLITVCPEGTVNSWGSNEYGQLGNGTNTDSYTPIEVSGLSDIISVSGGAVHNLALTANGSVFAWGVNTYGPLGNGTNTNSSVPAPVSNLSNVVAINASAHSMALTADSTIWAWGYNNYGQLGIGNNTSSNLPIQISTLSEVTAISSGTHHSLAIKADSTIWTWGRNSDGQIGNGMTGPSVYVPAQVSDISNVIAVAGGVWHSLAITSDSTVWAWGNNNYGQLGNGTWVNTNTPIPVDSITSVVAVAGGVNHSLALKADGSVWAWGGNNNGQLGTGNFNSTNNPVHIESLTNIVSVSAAWNVSSALDSTGTVWVWGSNQNGEMGNDSLTQSNIPIEVTGTCDGLVGVEYELKATAPITCYPNPTTGNILLDFGYTMDELTLNILNAYGVLIHSEQLNEVQTRQLQLPGTKGIYFVQLTNSDGHIETLKVVKK